ncbi:MAG: IS256 family transposase [Syntrophales bacterium]|nr:IS256 family transposase [Syntrophales bacterium]
MGKGITEAAKQSSRTYEMLEHMVRLKAQEYIQDILEEEVEEFLGRKKSERIELVDGTAGYRNGHGKPKKFALMNGTITVRRPRVRGTEDHFESKILPYFKRRSKEVGHLLPELYLHGLAKGDFELALRGLLGEGAPLSVSSIERLKAKWQMEYEEWKGRDLSNLKVVYQWADGIYVKAGLEKDKAALLIIIGALTNGKKVFLACESGYRESKESWSGVLRDMTTRGLKLGSLTIADGHLGIWSALGEIHPKGNEQRCWNHKIRNVLDSLPKRIRFEASEYLKRIPYAATLKECIKLRDAFLERYRKDYPKATEKLLRDWDRMVTFYSFPKEHWVHLRTSNVVESPFSTVRLRTDAAKRFKKIQNATAMIWKLLQVAEKSFRTLKGYWLLSDVYAGKKFVDGVMKHESKAMERIAA